MWGNGEDERSVVYGIGTHIAPKSIIIVYSCIYFHYISYMNIFTFIITCIILIILPIYQIELANV